MKLLENILILILKVKIKNNYVISAEGLEKLSSSLPDDETSEQKDQKNKLAKRNNLRYNSLKITLLVKVKQKELKK